MFRVSRNTQKPLANKLEPQKKAIENFIELIGKCFRLNSQDVVRTQMENFFAGAISLENLCNKLNLDINDFKLRCKEILRLSEDNHHYMNIRLIQPGYIQSRDLLYDTTSPTIFMCAEELDNMFNAVSSSQYQECFFTEINQRSVSSGSTPINTELKVDNNHTSLTKEEQELYDFIAEMSTVKNITFNKLTKFIQDGAHYTLEHFCRDIGLIELEKIEELKSKYPNIIESHSTWIGVRHHFCKEKFLPNKIDAALSEKFSVKIIKDKNSLEKVPIESPEKIEEGVSPADGFFLLQESTPDNNELGNVELQEFNSTLTVEDKKKLLASFIEKLFHLGILEGDFGQFFGGQKSLETILINKPTMCPTLVKEYHRIFQDNKVRLANGVGNSSHFTLPKNYYYKGADHYYNSQYFSQEDMVNIRFFWRDTLKEIEGRPKNDYLNLLEFLNPKGLDQETYIKFLAGEMDLEDFCKKAQLNAGELLEKFPHVFKTKDDVKSGVKHHEICFIPMPIQLLDFGRVANYLNKNKLSKK